jgi:hypothetical protein
LILMLTSGSDTRRSMPATRDSGVVTTISSLGIEYARPFSVFSEAVTI